MPAPWLTIVNPRAGGRQRDGWHQPLVKRLERELGAEVVFTDHPGHATALASAAREAEGFVVVGGDGTIGEVVNGMDLDRQAVLLLAAGTGNGLARDLGLASFEAGFAAARLRRRSALDLIRVSYRLGGQDRFDSRLAVSTAGVGYVADAVQLAGRYFKGLGWLCYPVAAAVQAARQGCLSLAVELDEGPAAQRSLSNVMVNNTQHAGNFRPFRRADLRDGRFEVLLARAGFIGQLAHNVSILSGTYLYAPAAEVAARTLSLRLAGPQLLMIDGELWEQVVEVRFEVLPGKLQCVVNGSDPAAASP